MKVLLSESKFGLEYLWDEVITPANENGVQCIVDDNADGSIYLYDPIKKQWATSQTLKEFGVDVTDAIEDRDTYGQAWLDCRDPEFRDFAIKWDELQKKDDADNVYKTKKCELIRISANEGTYCEFSDDSDDWSASEDEVEVQWMIDDKELGIESGSTETVVIDLGLVDSFEELVYQVELALEKAHGGMRFDYDDEWILVDEDNLLKRFGYNMN